MGQGDHHRSGAVDQEFERLLDQAQRLEPRVDGAVVAQDHLPGEHPQQVAGPERQRHQDDPDQFAPVDVKGDVVGHRVGDQHRDGGAGPGDPQRTDQQGLVDRFADCLLIVPERERGVDFEGVLGPEAHRHQDREGRAHGEGHHDQRGRKQRIAAQRFAAQERGAKTGLPAPAHPGRLAGYRHGVTQGPASSPLRVPGYRLRSCASYQRSARAAPPALAPRKGTRSDRRKGRGGDAAAANSTSAVRARIRP